MTNSSRQGFITIIVLQKSMQILFRQGTTNHKAQGSFRGGDAFTALYSPKITVAYIYLSSRFGSSLPRLAVQPERSVVVVTGF